MDYVSFLFFNETATTENYTYRHTLSLHDALPIFENVPRRRELGLRLKSKKICGLLQLLIAIASHEAVPGREQNAHDVDRAELEAEDKMPDEAQSHAAVRI